MTLLLFLSDSSDHGDRASRIVVPEEPFSIGISPPTQPPQSPRHSPLLPSSLLEGSRASGVPETQEALKASLQLSVAGLLNFLSVVSLCASFVGVFLGVHGAHLSSLISY